jgi:hypothetical protein
MRLNKTHLIRPICLKFLVILFLFSACKNQQKKEAHTTVALPADFLAFYEKFHADSAYQMAHIQFPLEGYPAYMDSSQLEKGTFYWQKEDWQIQNFNNFDKMEFTRHYEQPFEGVITEVIQKTNSPFGVYRRFYKRGDDWLLIFYSDMNSMKRE